MPSTRNDMPRPLRTKMVALLNARLADALDLYSHAKQAHWNVKGPNFIALHELFDSLAQQADAHADLIAERAVQLGGLVNAAARHVAAESTLPPFKPGLSDWKDCTKALADSLASFGKSVRKAIETADNAGDAATADLFTSLTRDIDKSLWLVESHLRGD